jgi:glycosyltransferase involved in cell wall biosynthesis
VKAIAVSQAHARNIRGHLTEACALRPLASKVPVDYIYNPIPDGLDKSDGPYDPTKLVYFSAPWKGLDLVLEAFQRVRRSMPDMRLYLACPGYTTADEAPAPGPNDNVTYLGRLAQPDALEQVRSALCVFYPANRVPESFGCVFAESHAVGTPVLAHPFGAACELLSRDELVDAEDIEAIVQRIRSWRNGLRPVVSTNDQVRLSTVAAAWERLLLTNH